MSDLMEAAGINFHHGTRHPDPDLNEIKIPVLTKLTKSPDSKPGELTFVPLEPWELVLEAERGSVRVERENLIITGEGVNRLELTHGEDDRGLPTVGRMMHLMEGAGESQTFLYRKVDLTNTGKKSDEGDGP